ncbi:hypothetical protein TNCV_3312791 [Trichonephila clavipes]|nr:hypothetical protein TNCV_3312791 [Trichonephila clavipes]
MEKGGAMEIMTENWFGRIEGPREGGFSFRDIDERLGRNEFTVHDFWQNGQAMVLPQEEWLRVTTWQ